MEEFGAIPVFVAVVEKGGFSCAARALGVSKSAVSKRINQLEAHLGVRLLHRTTRKLSLPDSTLVARKLAPLRQVICASPEYI